MKRKIFIGLALILSIFLAYSISFPGPKEVIEKRLWDGLKKDSEDWKGWRDGLRDDYKLELSHIKFTVEILDQQTQDEDLFAIIGVTIVSHVIDNSGIKKRFIRKIIMGYIFDKNNYEIKFGKILDFEDTIIGGWDGKDI